MATVFPAYPANTLAQAEDLIIFTGNQLGDIINGDALSEVETLDGFIPTIRKTLVDNFNFKSPIAWSIGSNETIFNQLRVFPDGSWWYAPLATTGSPVAMTSDPYSDSNWLVFSKSELTIFQNTKRLAAEAGYNLVGTFRFGCTITTALDVVLDEKEGLYYSWGGTLPKSVTAGSSPTPTGLTTWIDRTDVVLRDEISKLISVSSKVDLEAVTSTIDGALIIVANSYGVDHIRQLSASSDGSTGILTAGALYANLLVTEPCALYASQLFIASGSNQTTLFNTTLLPFIAANSVKKIVLDTGDVHINSTLDYAYGAITFSGGGQLLTNSLDNMLQRVGSEKTNVKQYHGSINQGAIFNEAIKAAALVKGELRVVLLGDSISVCSDYDSANAVAAGYINAVGVDNADRHDCFGAQLYAEICANVPSGVRVKFYSRSIGGLGYGNLDQAWDVLGALWSGREQVIAGKTWRDCVLDLKPDVVIHAMGMNETPKTYVDNFLLKWNSYLITEQKARTFDQVIVTTPNPNFNNAQQFGDFRQYSLNASKFYVAHLQRYMAKLVGASLIDVAFQGYLKRYGFDPRSCAYRSDSSDLTFTDGTKSKVVPPGSNVLNAEFTPDYLPIYHSTTFTINPSVASSEASFDFKFAAGSVIVQFTAGVINLFSGAYPGTLGIKGVGTPFVLSANTSYTFTVTVNPSGLFLYYGSDMLLTISDVPYEATLPMRFENPSTGFNVTVESGIVRGQQFARYSTDTSTNGEFYGELAYTSNEFGGGINHPSTVGLMEMYIPPCREFLNNMLRSDVINNSIVGGTTANEAVFIGRVLNKQYNHVTVSDYGSGLNVVIDVGAGSAYTVVKNTNNGSIAVYFDASDMSLFLINPNSPLLQLEYSGEWLSTHHYKMGVKTPRGVVLPTVA